MKVAATPEGSDPADVAGRDSVAWKKAVAESRQVINFVLEQVKQSGVKGRKLSEEVKRAVLPFVAAVENRIEQAQYVRKIAEDIGVQEDAVWEELRKTPLPSAAKTGGPVFAAAPPKDSILRRLAGLYFAAQGADVSLSKKIHSELVRILGKDKTAEVMTRMETEKDILIMEAERGEYAVAVPAKEAPDLIFELERDILRTNFAESMKALGEAEKKKDNRAALKELKRCQELSQQLSLLNSTRKS